MVFSLTWGAGEKEGELIPSSVGEGEGLLVPLQFCSLWRRWEAAWEGLAPCWDLRCHLPQHHHCCQTGLREGPSFGVSWYSRMKFPSSKGGEEGNLIFLSKDSLPVLCMTGMIMGQEGENPIKCITGWEALTFCFSPLPLLSPAFRLISGAALKRKTRRRKHSNHIDTTPVLQQAIEIFLFYSHLNSGKFGNSDNLRSVHSAFVCVRVFPAWLRPDVLEDLPPHCF